MAWPAFLSSLAPSSLFPRLQGWFTLPRRLTRDLVLGLLLGISLSLSSTSAALLLQQYKRKKAIQRIPPRPIELRAEEIGNGMIGLIGNTPLIRINSLSDALGVEIMGKCEFLNPGGSVKDRVALRIIEDAEADGLLHPHTGSVLFEGTVGSTGISLATVGRAKGYECCIIMPDDVAIEKVQVLEKLGARVERVRPASYVDEKQFVNMARKRAHEFGRKELVSHCSAEDSDETQPDLLVTISQTPADSSRNSSITDFSFPSSSTSTRPATPLETSPHPSRSPSPPPVSRSGRTRVRFNPSASASAIAAAQRPRGFFCDQFENQSNFDAHYHGTGPEILRQTSGNLDAFVSGAGTGGTISGTGKYLKEHVRGVKVVMSDPEGSGLYNKVKYNVMYDSKESEGKKRRHQVDTVVEGIGINRITHNFAQGLDIIDDAYRITDVEAVAMSRYLVTHNGLYLGSSSACNLVASVRLAKKLGKGARIVTILCDSGSRHQSKFWSDDYLAKNGIEITPSLIDDMLAS
ncbi:putative cysteine synthase [Dioszegia hungarica]|uniref:cysteine synthase n=1 Tax=Dioszegia hungarica TaxID=4972 RepID=A0AA38H0E0_9TREE|nr:putative cysteine synthase [Dioszegia hungarica]KAI9632477.1 putative cysteine synthase [Dioszegia hungarica]